MNYQTENGDKHMSKTSARKKTLASKIRGNVLKGKAFTKKEVMEESGYSPSYADSGRSTKTLREVLEQYFPDDKIAQIEAAQLEASHIDHYVFTLSISDEEIKEVVESYPNCKLKKIVHTETTKHAYFYSPDNFAVAKSLDRIYKLKGSYSAQKVQIEDPMDGLSDEEIADRIAEKQRILKRYEDAKKQKTKTKQA